MKERVMKNKMFKHSVMTTLLAGAVAAAAMMPAHAQQPRSGANLNAPNAPEAAGGQHALLPGEPAYPAPGSWGYDKTTGKFKSPDAAPDAYGAHPVEGSLPYLDLNQYAKNVKVENFLPYVAGAGHSWQA